MPLCNPNRRVFNPVRSVSDFVRRHPTRGQRIECADQRNRDGGGCAGRRPRRNVGEDRNLQRHVVWQRRLVDRGFQKRMPRMIDAARHHHIALAIIFCVERHLMLAAGARKHRHLHLDIRVDADVENCAMPGKPRVCPSAKITDADGRHAVDDQVRLCGR